jgi:hypothetical protein
MDTIVTPPTLVVAPTTLDEARTQYVSMVGGEYGAGKIYAQFLINEFGEEWIDAAHDAPGANMDAFRKERSVLYAAIKPHHSNPSVKLKQIKDHARNILAAMVKAESAEGESAEGSGESAEGSGKRELRSVQRRMLEDLTEMYRFLNRATLNEGQAKARLCIRQALVDIGVENPDA